MWINDDATKKSISTIDIGTIQSLISGGPINTPSKYEKTKGGRIKYVPGIVVANEYPFAGKQAMERRSIILPFGFKVSDDDQSSHLTSKDIR